MRKFPKIEENQVLLVRAENKTGIILDEKLEYLVNDNQKWCTVFSSLEYAKEQAILFVRRSNGNVECAIYDSKEELTLFIDNNNIDQF
ncbi:hypothetical protein [Vallitalea sp.]|jgi:hypothetical protein|uniref:hypothetical protein n=1 Tax=Vallitalea sp. TaxID=1882829 RepID=UPI0025D3BB1E|nr:hypothetical protein [Vallitalea sp.]MCT4686871.1 hypothetical protein [Vallitalea sp.]